MISDPTKTNPAATSPAIALEHLLRRGDVWRGHSQHFAPRLTLDSGHEALNAALLNKGWPLGSLIEVCQQEPGQSEWLLLKPALLKTTDGYVVLLNPPATPFAQSLLQAGIDLERVLVVQTQNKADFLASFSELARTQACDALLAWQPKQALSYTELRKCLLAAADGQGLYLLFRPLSARQQSSPAALRLAVDIQTTELQVAIFKQKGLLPKQQTQAIKLTLPTSWQGFLPHALLDQVSTPSADVATGSASPRTTGSTTKPNNVTPIVRGKS